MIYELNERKDRKTGRLIIHLFMMIAMIFTAFSLYAQRTKSSLSAGNQRNAEKGLRDNRYFFYFINASITNRGTDDEKKMFKEAIQRDIIAQSLYMKFLFRESFVEIRNAQAILINLYRMTLGKDIDETKMLLNKFAPMVIQRKSCLARHYIRLGYRDAADAKADMVMADNFQARLYSMRLYRYSKAIKKIKHGKRYALFSLIEAKAVPDRKRELGLLGFNKLKELIAQTSGDDQKDFHLLIHTDNYYKSKDEKSFYDRIWEKPDLDEIKEYEEYLKLN